MSLPEPRRASLPPMPPRWASAVTRADVRVGDPEREAVVELLAEHYAHGRLGHDDLELRTRTALAATTRGELTRVVADLPELPGARSAGPGYAAIVVATVVAVGMGVVAAILGLITLFTIASGQGWGWFAAFCIAAAISAGGGLYAARGLRQRRASRRNPW